MDTKISVIIPIYNAEKYLEQTLNSIRFQSCENLEIICLLDCPTDSSVQIVENIAKEDMRIKPIYYPHNIGPALARNLGIQNAVGEYIHFMDSDDLISPDFYKNMLTTAIETDSDVTACSVFYENKPGESIWFCQNEIVYDSEKIEKTKVISAGWVWRYLIKKSFWNHRNLLFPNLQLFEDTPVMIQMIYYANKVAFCPNAVYFYKNRVTSLIKNRMPRKHPKELYRKENFRTAHALCLDFIRKHKIKYPSKFEQKLYKYLTLRKKNIICENDPIKYGEKNTKISVVIPVYNAEKYLKKTLDSVCFQTYKNLEIVCVLDCPTDNSAEVAKEMAKGDSRIKLVEHSKNRGLPAARNSGVENATGEYIHFMDSDDLLSPDFYEIMISAAINADADVAACSVFYEKKRKKSIWFQKSEILSDTNDKIQKTEVVIQGWAWRYLIKRNFWNERNFSFPDLVPMEDMPVMIPMIYYANKVVLCPSAVYFYKNREDSILNKKQDPVREKQRSENRKKARKMFKDFMRTHRIKRPNRLLYLLKKRFL
jgi:glycosyltransferase involved in cell wall biosynthesis